MRFVKLYYVCFILITIIIIKGVYAVIQSVTGTGRLQTCDHDPFSGPLENSSTDRLTFVLNVHIWIFYWT